MGIANTSIQQIRIGKQSAKGTILPAADAGAKLYNFVDATGNLAKDSFESNTIRTTQQRLNPRHGTRSVPFTLNQELQIGGHNDLVAGMLRAAFATAATTGSTSQSLDVSARTITRASGSYITDGFKVGDIVRISGAADADNNSVNLRITAVVALQMNYADDAWLPAGMSNITTTAFTVAVPGKKCSIPASGHTADYFTIEDWQSDVPSSRRHTDCRVASMSVAIPPNGHATVGTTFLGIDSDPQTTEWFTNETAASTGALLAGPQGLLRYNGVDSAVVSDVSINITNSAEVKSVVGTDLSPDVFVGSTVVTGSFSAMFDSNAFFTNFEAETVAPLYIYLFEDSTAGSDFVCIKIPATKINSSDSANDGVARTVSANFSGGENVDGSTTIEQTSIVYHDSTAT